MVSEPLSTSTYMMSSSSSTKEPQLTIQSFHQCSSLVSIKLTLENFLLWRSQILRLVKSLGLYHHLTDGTSPAQEIEDDKGAKTHNPQYELWNTNDDRLLSWLLGTMKEEVMSDIFGAETTYEAWTSLEEQLLPMTAKKQGHLKNMLMTIKKRTKTLEEYIREFKSICDKLAAIKQPVPDLDKVFQVA